MEQCKQLSVRCCCGCTDWVPAVASGRGLRTDQWGACIATGRSACARLLSAAQSAVGAAWPRWQRSAATLRTTMTTTSAGTWPINLYANNSIYAMSLIFIINLLCLPLSDFISFHCHNYYNVSVYFIL